MNILITFDGEVWCTSWKTLDADFPSSFERYVFGRSRFGEYALPKNLEILSRYGLKAVFFVEPLFAARFGVEPLAKIVDLLKDAGQEIQLHLHPEWTDEALTPLLPNVTGKRQHLSYYDALEQHTLIAQGLRLLREAGVTDINAFRAGSFACNRDTFRAVAANGLLFDASLNATMPISAPDLRDDRGPCYQPFKLDGLSLYPMSVFRDGLGRFRHAQVGACSAAELRQAILSAKSLGWESFVMLSHNFELLKPDSLTPDFVVPGRFEALCRFLDENRRSFPTVGFRGLTQSSHQVLDSIRLPRTTVAATSRRYVEQAVRRFL